MDFKSHIEKFFNSFDKKCKVYNCGCFDETITVIKLNDSYAIAFDNSDNTFYVMIEKIYHGDYFTPDDSEFVVIKENFESLINACEFICLEVIKKNYHEQNERLYYLLEETVMSLE